MTDPTTRSALVTGATSGLGFEASAQLAEAGYRKVTISARTRQKAEIALAALLDRTGKDVFDYVVIDNDHLPTVEAAVAELVERDDEVDFLLLNTGVAPPKDLVRTSDGIEATVAASLIGHHVLAVRLLEKGLLGNNARIVIAGSEAARGDVPTFNPVDFGAFAAENFGGDLEAAIESQIRMEPPAQYKPGDTYATAKLFVAWWAAELADRLPSGMTVNAVSPGSTPDTDAARNAPFYMRRIMMPIFKIVPGMSHSVETGAGRYIEASTFDDTVTGNFFASKPKKMTGPLVTIEMDHVVNPEAQRALWVVTSRVAGGVGNPLHV